MDYKNLYWTRLMSIGDFEVDQARKWQLGPDLIEECQAVVDMEAVDPDEWEPLFDPHKFNVDNGPLELEQYRLPQEDLRAWAERCVKLRETIAAKAKRQTVEEPEE